jgi:prepilin-type N-terminal cleavage/methylation domain-containing protein
MRTSLAGKRNSQHGVTLLEMLVVAVLIGLLASLTFPSVSAGLESLRLSSASNSLVSFLNGALNRAERREEAMEIVISPHDNSLVMYSSEPGFERKLEMPDGVTIAAVLPAVEAPPDAPRRFMLMPGGVPPRIGVVLVNRQGRRRIVRVDPITGVPQIEAPETP